MSRKKLEYPDLPDVIRNIIEERQSARAREDYAKSDMLRKRLEEAGYVVQDKSDKCEVFKEYEADPKHVFLSLFGSGVVAPNSQVVHEYVLKHMHVESVRIAIISTPAGFQPNVRAVYQEYVDFFALHLQNYHPHISVIYANSDDDANNTDIIAPLCEANYIVAGAGSPTYAVKHLAGTLLLKVIIKRVRDKKASLALSSAATIACSEHTLPVYEIFKVGEDLHWEKGLDLYKHIYGQSLTIIPHFNNTEGGEKLDTACCYMGKERFERLYAMLPSKTTLWGIDEYSALTIQLDSKEEKQFGAGTVSKMIR